MWLAFNWVVSPLITRPLSGVYGTHVIKLLLACVLLATF
jgi:hypothetical protein